MRLDPAKLKAARELRGFSQEALAARCELSRKSVQRAETGDDVRPDTAAAFAAALGIGVAELKLREPAAGVGQPASLVLRRVASGSRVLDILSQAHAGRITCDVEADGTLVGPLAALIGLLQDLAPEHWAAAPTPPAERPLLERLRLVAQLNDLLRELEGLGVHCFLGHYYRYSVAQGEAGRATGRDDALLLARAHLSQARRASMTVAVEREWRGRDAAPDPDAFQPDERFVFLSAEPPLQGASAAEDGVIEGEFSLVR